MKKEILLVGGGGHCKVILDMIFTSKDYKVAGIIDLAKHFGDNIFGVTVIGSDTDLPRFFKSGIKYCFISVGSIGNPTLRVKLYKLARQLGYKLPNLISPNAIVSSNIYLGEGNYIAPGAIINAGARIGNGCIINTGSVIEHDCEMGDFVHISPGSVLSGGVKIGKYSHIGLGSFIIQNTKIGENTIIGAGSVVTKNIRKGVIAYGNPCRERKKNA